MNTGKTHFKKGCTPWNKGKSVHYMLGENNPAKRPEVRMKISNALRGIKKSVNHIEKNRISHLGIRPSNETKIKMSVAAKKIVASGKHHLWKGGVSFFNRPFRKNIELLIQYRTWRENIFKRDNYTCQICGERGGKLHADHVIPFTELIESENIKTLKQAEKSIILWDLLNGRTLCISCHRKTDTYGRSYNQLSFKRT